ncbi:MAG: hypothetical protein AAFZ63_01325 [Bacteroidota bacterium]
MNKSFIFSSLTILILFFILASCNTESLEEDITPVSIEKSRGLAPSPTLGNVFVGIVREGSCDALKHHYTIYASASETHNQDREVQAGVIKNGAFVEAKILIIPAGKRVSNNVAAFSHAPETHGNVTAKAFNVLVGGQIISGYSFPAVQYDVQNCYLEDFGCTGIFGADDPNTTAVESAGDADNDGICNFSDIDDNGNNFPDVWED